jgi:AsmA protein
MKRLAIVVATAVVLFAGVLMLAPQFIPADTARAEIAEQIEQWIGRPVSFSGEPSITFFPRPRVRLENVIIEDSDGSGAIFIQVD